MIAAITTLAIAFQGAGWMSSSLSSGKAEFASIREEIHRKYGDVPEGAGLTRDADTAIKALAKDRSQTSLFRAVYLRLCTFDPQLPKGTPDPWAVLPKDDYEVARLHFLWAANDAAKPLGEKLLQKDPKDAEVLWRLSYLYSHVGKKPSWDPAKGITMARSAMVLAPCAKTNFRYADALSMLLAGSRPDPATLKDCSAHFDLYLRDAKKDDPDLPLAKQAKKWLAGLGAG